MRKVTSIIVAAMFVLFVGNLFAQVGDAVVVDQTGTDFQYYWYVGTIGQQICVDEEGTVHIAYCKTYCTESDTGHQVMYANATTGTTIPIPSDPSQAEKPIQPGEVFIDGGHDGTPVYMMYGVGGRFYQYGPEMSFQTMAKLSDDGNSVEPLGVQEAGMYYGGANYSNPFQMEVDNVNGIVHCVETNPSGWELAYWNFDGSNFGQPFNVYAEYPDQSIPGLSPNDWYAGYTSAGYAQGADLAVSPDGSEVAVSGLHPRRQIDIIIGELGGELWPNSWGDGYDNGTVILLYDTTGQREGTNIPNDDPKPYCDLQISYDSESNLHVVFDAAWIDVYIDTCAYFPGSGSAADDWWRNHSSACVGDTNANFYDGTEHPKPQLCYWNNVSNTITKLADCAYPMAGEEFKWRNSTVTWDSGGAGNWGKNYDDSIISNFDLISNKDPQAGEPDLVCVWEEMDAPVTQIVDGVAFADYYWAFTTDLKMSYYKDGVWSAPVNLTNSPGVGEQSVSVYNDVIDNKIHMMYYRDDFPGRDRNLCYTPDWADQFVLWTEGGQHYSQPIRTDPEKQVDVVYQPVDLTAFMTSIKGDKYLPGEFALEQNFPNPFNPTTTINYTVPAGDVTLEVFNVLGQKVKTLVHKVLTAGNYEEVWDGTNDAGKLVSSGVYLYKIKSKAGVKVKKMMFQK